MTTTIASKTVPLLDLSAQHREIRDEILAEVTRVIDSQKFILGDEVKQLEQAIAPIAAPSMRLAALPVPTRSSSPCWRSTFSQAMRCSLRRIRSSPRSAQSAALARFPSFWILNLKLSTWICGNSPPS